MPKAVVFAVALALLCAAGCGGRDGGKGNRPVSYSVDKGENPGKVVKNAVASRTALSSISGKGVMRIIDQPSKFGLTVNANVIADEQDRLRIRADKLAGAIQAFDVVMLGDDIGFYIPTQKTLYHGKVKDLQGFSFRFEPDEVLNQMLRPDTSLLARKWRYADGAPAAKGRKGKGSAGGSSSITLEEVVPEGRPYLRLVIDQRNGTIASVTQMNGRGEAIMIKRYEDYRNLARSSRGGRVSDNESVFPYLISFNWPRDKRTMEMHFKQVQGNVRVSDEDFDLATSSDTRNRPLREATMESDDGGSVASAGSGSRR